MDANGLDQLAKVTAHASRRHALRLLAGGAFAGVLARLGLTDAGAAPASDAVRV